MKTFVKAFVIVCVSALVLGCSGGQDSADTASPDATPNAQPAVPANPNKKLMGEEPVTPGGGGADTGAEQAAKKPDGM